MSESQLLVHLEQCAMLGDADRSELLSKLLPDTDEYVYLKLTDDLVKSKGLLEGDALKAYQRLVGKDKVVTDFRRGIKLRKMLYDLSNATDDDKRKSLCKEFNKMSANSRFTHRRPKIAEGMTTNTGDGNKLESTFISKLNPQTEELFGADKVVQEYKLSSIKSGYLLDRNLDEIAKMILDKNPSIFPKFLNKLPTLTPFKHLNKHLTTYIKKESGQDFGYLFKRLTLSELTALGNEYKDLKDLGLPYINEMYYKSYADHPSVNAIKDISTVKQIYNMALGTKVSAAFPGLSRLVLKVLLTLLAKDNKTDAEFLEDFIKNPSCEDPIFSRKLMTKYVYDYNSYTFVSDTTSTPELVTKHLKMLYRQDTDIMKYADYFNSGYLSKLHAEQQLKAGKKVKSVLEVFTKTELDFVNQEKCLSFVNKQKDFVSGQTVSLSLEVKNINKVTMKVFEINTVNYCTELQANVDDNVKLDGLVSIAEKVYVYDQPSIIAHIETYELDILANKTRGVFVIDFLGDGTTSRTIIRKGMLNVLMKRTRTGYTAKIVDDEFNVCKGEHTGIYYQNKYYAASEEGIVRFDFPNSTITANLILRHGNFCYVARQSLQAASTSISSVWLFNEETFLPGNKCTMLLRSNMIVANQRVPVSNIKSAELSAIFTKTNGLSSTQEVGAIELKDDEDYVFSFYLPNGSNNIHLIVKYTYMANDGSTQTSNSVHTIYLADRNGLQNKTHVFLRSQGDQFVLLHLGKNGEPIANTEFKIMLQHVWRKDIEEGNAVTDSQGQIKLGSLEGVSSVGVQGIEVANEKLNTFFNLTNRNSSYPIRDVKSLEGETVQLPVLSQFEQNGIAFALYKINKQAGTVVEECSSQVSKKESFYSIEGLPTGEYIFRYTKSHVVVNITVLQKGSYLNQETILSGDRIIDVAPRQILCSNIISESVTKEGDKELLQINLDKYDSETRVHIFSSTFLAEGNNRESISASLNNLTSSIETAADNFSIQKPKTSYLEDRQLPGEMLYAMNRRNNEAAIGTTSEKPSLFIKRQEVRDTNYKSENVNNGGDYFEKASDEDSDEIFGAPTKPVRARKEMSYRDKKKSGGYGGASTHSGVLTTELDDYENLVNIHFTPNTSSYSALYFEKHRHFLKQPSSCAVNLHPNSSGKIQVPLEQFNSRTLSIYVINNSVCSSKTITVEGDSDELLKTDLTLQNPSSSLKMFAYERDVYRIAEGAKLQVPGFSSCEYELIDSVAKLIQVKSELSGSSLGTDWNFLKEWGTTKIVQKVEKVNQLFSYELAVFLFKKDRDLFDVTLKDFIKCKVNKGVVDYYLLEDRDGVASFLTATKASTLNSLEKICIIDLLAQSHAAQCQHLLQSLQGEDASNPYDDSMAFNTIFDRIVNLGDKKGGNLILKRKNDIKNDAQFDDEDQDDDSCPSSDNSCPTPRYENRNRAANRNYSEKKEERSKKEQRCEEEERCEEETEYNYDDMFGDEQNCNYMQQECVQMPIQLQAQQRIEMDRPIKAPRHQRYRRRLRNCEEEDGDSEDEDEDSIGGGANENFDYMSFKNKKAEPSVTRLQQDSLKTTKEYREMGYYFQGKTAETYKIESNIFWIDLAKYLLSDRKEPFLSQNFVYVEKEHLPFVIAFLDLSQTAASQKFDNEGSETFLTLSGGNALLYLKHLKEREAVQDISNTVLAAQKWFDRDERFEYNLESGKNEEKTIDYFLTGKIYGSQVVVTNVSSVEQKIQIITEIPEGAIPVIKNDFHQSVDLKLNQFSTHTSEFFFYFPKTGDFSYCPACVTREGKKVNIQVASTTVKVLSEPPKKTELKNIKDILAQGSKEDILAFMRKENITNPKVFNFSDIYWLLRDEQFYRDALKILREKMIFNSIVWSYSLHYGDVETFFELMSMAPNKGLDEMDLYYFNNEKPESPLELKGFCFLEYHPILNARFHQLSKANTSILNNQFRETYFKFLKYLFEKDTRVNIEDRLILTYYLLLQDRIDEAFNIYSKIPADSTELDRLTLQYDYMGAYFDLYKGMPAFTKAKAICEKYFDYPVTGWRSMFIEIANQLAEISGETAEVKEDKSKDPTQTDQEIVKGTLQTSELIIEYGNVSTAKVELFEIDLEVLFSLYPFRTNEFDKLVFSEPHYTENVSLVSSSTLQTHRYKIPKPYSDKNLLVKVTIYLHSSHPLAARQKL